MLLHVDGAKPKSVPRLVSLPFAVGPGDIAKENAGEFRALLIELLAHCARTRIFSIAELKRAQQFNLTEEELAKIETAAKRGPAATEHVPSAIELTPDTLESLKNLGYFN